MRFKLLGKSGLRVSELCLGTMTFGNDWGWGAEKDVAQQIFNAYTSEGGNFIDTSNNYTDGSSETIVGDCMASDRDYFVIATKYTLQMANGNRKDPNLGGNSRKSMMNSVENSLRRLNTDYIDILYLHMWDFMTPIDEVLHGVNDLIQQGKVLYFAMSDTPAWVVSQAVTLAEVRGWARPVATQFPYSVLGRSAERDVMPMARALDLAMLPWGVLSGGTLTGKYTDSSDTTPKRERSASSSELNMAQTLGTMSKEIGQTPSQIAINFVRQQPGNIIPIIGARTLGQIQDNLGALDFELTEEQINTLRDATDFKIDFPLSFLTDDHVRGLIFGETFGMIDIHRPEPYV